MRRAVDYRESHLAADKGESYDRRFADNPHRSLMWEMEKRILDRVLTTLYDGRRITHLDFACGTGRLLAYLEPRARESVGVDLSPSMLAVARRSVSNATLIEADLTRADVLAGRKFDLITAFRFFPNAQPTLRQEAMSAILRHLDDSGYLVFNNHLNSSSTMLRLARLAGRSKGLGMEAAEVTRLLDDAGLQVVAVHHLGIMPSNDRYLFMPLALLGRVERYAAKHDVFRNISQNLIYVCSRSGR